jgi:hypothetical protein
MKKFLLASQLLVSSRGFSQRFQVGIKAGVNISNFVGVNFEGATTESLVGFHGGGFIGFFIGDHFSIQPEILFSTQGAHFKDISSGVEEDFKMNYLNIPIMVKYEFDGGFYVETGPQAGINISSLKFDEMSTKDLTNGSDFGWGFGLGFHFPFGLGIGARYNLGLSKVGNANFDDPDFKNSVIQIGLFYTIFNNHMHK